MTVPGFPNLFLVYGPNTNLGGSSVLAIIESQAGYIGQAVDLLASGADELEVRADVAERYDREIQRRLAGSVWTAGCRSWYHADGGRVTTNWPGLVEEYRERTATLQASDYYAASEEPATA